MDVREIGPIAVHPDYHGKGIGKKLMNGVMSLVNSPNKSFRLLVNTHNPVSFSLYLSMGFQVQMSCVVFSNLPTKSKSNLPENYRFLISK